MQCKLQTTVELPQVQFLDKDADIHAVGEARTNVKLLGADPTRRSTLICPIRQEDEDRTLRSGGGLTWNVHRSWWPVMQLSSC